MVSERFSLREFLGDIVAPHSKVAATKGLRWEFDVHPDTPDDLIGDPVRLRQVVDQLLNYAVKFTETGSVRMYVKADNRQAANKVKLFFTIMDTGPGLSPDNQEMLEGFSHPRGGAGLGLAICRVLIERLGGHFTVASQLGEGCTFQFTVPVAMLDTTDRSMAPLRQATEGGESEAASCGLHVLLADDTPANQKVIGRILRKRGHNVSIAANGREALELAAQTSFDVILMDLQMPLMDGCQAASAIRELERRTNRHTPIIALTAHSTDRDHQACLQAGMDGYLAKPIDVAELTAVVESAAQVERPSPVAVESRPVTTHVASAAERAADKTIDLAATMKRLGGDEELFRQFIEFFNEDSPRLLGQLASAIGDDDCGSVVQAAHSLRGLAANFSASSVIELASTIEDAAKRKDLTGTDLLLERLSSAVDNVTRTLDRYRKS